MSGADMMARGRPSVLCLGVTVQDFIFAVDHMPDRAEKYRARDLAMAGGGCAATAAVAVARLGGSAWLATRLGDDPVADGIIDELRAYGVEELYIRRFPGRRSSLSSVFVDREGERMIVNYRDPDLPDDTDWLPNPAEIPVDVVLADTRWPAGAAAILAAAQEAGVPGVLDAEAPVHEAADALRAASHIAFSRSGLEDWTGNKDLASGLQSVAAETGAFVCVTDGANGVLFGTDGDLAHMPAFRVEAVDTLGAGDVWHGAFALALARGCAPPGAIRHASAAAALTCTRFGGRAGIPNGDEVDAYLSRISA